MKGDRKAQGLMIGYVLLIVLAIGISIVVYSQLKSFVPQETEEAPDGTSIAISDYSYDGETLIIDLTNNGRFNIGGVIIKGSTLSKIGVVSFGDEEFAEDLKPGDSKEISLNTKNKNLLLEQDVYGWANNSQLAWIVDSKNNLEGVHQEILCYDEGDGSKWYVTGDTYGWGDENIEFKEDREKVGYWVVVQAEDEDRYKWLYYLPHTGDNPSASGTQDGQIPDADCYWPPLNFLSIKSIEIIPYIEKDEKKLLASDAVVRQNIEKTLECINSDDCDDDKSCYDGKCISIMFREAENSEAGVCQDFSDYTPTEPTPSKKCSSSQYIQFSTSTLEESTRYNVWVRVAKDDSGVSLEIGKRFAGMYHQIISGSESPSRIEEWEWIQFNKKDDADNYIFNKEDFDDGIDGNIVVKALGTTGYLYIDKLIIAEEGFNPN